MNIHENHHRTLVPMKPYFFRRCIKPAQTLIALYVLAMLFVPCQALADRKALVIGNDDYPGNQLKNAVNDATSVAKAFASLGYSTTLVTNAFRRSMADSIENFAQSLSKGDTAIVYYAGHGLQVDGENYLVPTDFRVASPEDVRYQGYSLSSLLSKLTAHGAATEIVILDACRNNPFRGTRSIQGGWASVPTSAGTLLAFGTSPGSTASDDPSASHGLFTQELLKYLTTSNVSAEKMFQQVRENVIEASKGTQVPWTASSLIGSFHFRPGLDMSPVRLPSLSVSQKDNTIGPPQRSIASMAQRGSNHFTASSLFAQQRSSSPIHVNGGDERDYYPLIARAARLANDGDYGNSVRTLKAVLSLDPQSALALRILGLVFNLMGQPAKSVDSLNRAVMIDPENAQTYYYRCIVRGFNEASAAVEDCEASLGIDPNNGQVHLGLAAALLSLGQLDRARTEAEQAIELAPNCALGYSSLGKILASEGDTTGADEEYQRAISVDHAHQPSCFEVPN